MNTQAQINIFIDEELPALTSAAREKALRKLFKIIANDNENGQIQTVRNLKLSQLLEESANDIATAATASFHQQAR